MIDKTGGSHGVRDLGLLESAVMRPKATFGGEELYSDVFSKAAALMHSLIRNHPFVDGNKRTGIAAAGLFLAQNGVQLTGKKRIPNRLPDYIGIGDDAEAVVYAAHHLNYWRRTPGAIEWLGSQRPDAAPPPKGRVSSTARGRRQKRG